MLDDTNFDKYTWRCHIEMECLGNSGTQYCIHVFVPADKISYFISLNQLLSVVLVCLTVHVVASLVLVTEFITWFEYIITQFK